MLQSKTSALLLSAMVAGTLDILAAIFLLAGGNAAGTFRYIARGAFGEAAFTGGNEMILYGILFHYFIALSFAAVYFFAYPFLNFLKRQTLISGLLYGLVVWLVMHFMVLPLTYNAPDSFDLVSNWKNILILVGAVGLPISLITSWYYQGVNTTKPGSR